MHVTFNIINLIIMKRFNLTEQVKDLIKGYTDKCGTQYFILSMANEFNPAVMTVGFSHCSWNITQLCITAMRNILRPCAMQVGS